MSVTYGGSDPAIFRLVQDLNRELADLRKQIAGARSAQKATTGTLAADATTTSSTAEAVNLLASLTPSSSAAQIKIRADLTGTIGTAGASLTVTLFSGSATVATKTVTLSGTGTVPVPFSVSHSPGSAKAVTYGIAISNSDNAATVGLVAGSTLSVSEA